MDWAKYRRRKAAAKLHLRLDLQTFLPCVAIIEEASHHDSTRAVRLCAGLAAGEVCLFDKAYAHFVHLYELTIRGVYWVTRAKDNMRFRVERTLQANRSKGIVKDQIIELKTAKAKADFPILMRRVVARVEVDSKIKTMVFLTNNFDWAASSVAQLYQAPQLGHRGFLQADQADPQAGGVHRIQQKGHPVADLGRAAHLAAGTFLGLPLPVAPQLRPPGGYASFPCLGVFRPARSAHFPWDSKRPIPNDGNRPSGLSPGAAPALNPILWDSTRSIIPKADQKSQNHGSCAFSEITLNSSALRLSIAPYGTTVIEHISKMQGVYTVNMSQPEYNDLEKIFQYTINKEIKLFELSSDTAAQAMQQERDLHGNVPCW